jgi:opacity protein-like surface antigen
MPDDVDLGDAEDIVNGIGGFNVPLGNATTDSKITTDWSISVSGRLGWLASPSTLLYVLGACEIGLNINSPTRLMVKLPDSLDGFSLGGREVKVGGPWTLRLEYRWTHLRGSAGKASSKDDPCCVGFDPIGLFRNVDSTASADLDLNIQTVRARSPIISGRVAEDKAAKPNRSGPALRRFQTTD